MRLDNSFKEIILPIGIQYLQIYNRDNIQSLVRIVKSLANL